MSYHIENEINYDLSAGSDGGVTNKSFAPKKFRVLHVDNRDFLYAMRVVIKDNFPNVSLVQNNSIKRALVRIERDFRKSQEGQLPYDGAIIAPFFTNLERDPETDYDGLTVISRLEQHGMLRFRMALHTTQKDLSIISDRLPGLTYLPKGDFARLEDFLSWLR